MGKLVNLQDCFGKSNFFRYSNVLQQNNTIENYKFLCKNNVTNYVTS